MKRNRQLTFLSQQTFSLEETKRGINFLLAEKTLRFFIYFNLLLIFTGFLIFFLFYSSLPPQVPLFYSRPWGEEQLGESFWLMLLPGGSLLIFLFNNLMATHFVRQEKILAEALAKIKRKASFLKILGSYPRARI